MFTTNHQLYPIALSLCKGIGPVLYKRLIDHFGSAENTFKASEKALCNIVKKKDILLSLLSEKKDLLKSAQRFRENHIKKGVHILAYGEDDYPTRLAQIHAPPSLLYCTNKIDFNNSRMVSIVGTRQSTPYGKRVTQTLVAQLKEYNAVVVSGLAYGIDITAHKAALNNKIPTVAVIPGGIDMIYPPEHIEVAKQFQVEGGGIITEYSLGVKPSIHHFIARNKIIAALSEATIIVEAPQQSGALTTAYFATEFDRDVFAVPGSIQTQRSSGCHALIKKHAAHLLTHINDLAYIMNWSSTSTKKRPTHIYQTIALTSQEKQFMHVLERSSLNLVTIEAMSASLHMDPKMITSLALQLELKGALDIIGGQYRAKT